jgi:hypothetical protein
MKRLFSRTALAVLMFGAIGAAVAEPPTFERNGFPVSPHQLQVLGPEGVQESAPVPTLNPGGMPASPHQLAVLRKAKDKPLSQEPHQRRHHSHVGSEDAGHDPT